MFSKHAVRIYSLFDYYAALGSSEDFTHIQYNAYKRLVTECDLIDEASEYARSTDWDALFVSVRSPCSTTPRLTLVS